MSRHRLLLITLAVVGGVAEAEYSLSCIGLVPGNGTLTVEEDRILSFSGFIFFPDDHDDSTLLLVPENNTEGVVKQQADSHSCLMVTDTSGDQVIPGLTILTKTIQPVFSLLDLNIQGQSFYSADFGLLGEAGNCDQFMKLPEFDDIRPEFPLEVTVLLNHNSRSTREGVNKSDAMILLTYIVEQSETIQDMHTHYVNILDRKKKAMLLGEFYVCYYSESRQEFDVTRLYQDLLYFFSSLEYKNHIRVGATASLPALSGVAAFSMAIARAVPQSWITSLPNQPHEVRDVFTRYPPPTPSPSPVTPGRNGSTIFFGLHSLLPENAELTPEEPLENLEDEVQSLCLDDK